MLRYAEMLERELRVRGHQVSIAYPPAPLLTRFGKSAPFAKWIAYLDKYVFAPRALRSQARTADVVHVCDHSNSMYLGLAGRTPSVITCHDLLAVYAAQGRFAGIHVGATGRLLQRWIASGLLRARYVICVSRKTQEDLRAIGGGTGPESTVVHNPLNWDFRPVEPEQGLQVLRQHGVAAERYLLHIGSNSWYKNRPAAVHIFAQLRQSPEFAGVKLILAGKPWDGELRRVVDSSGVRGDVVELHDVANEELRALYSGALALLFPSRHEGFGWPILEAQACGCPVITTDRAPMTEVAGDAAILINPDQPAEAAQTILAQMHRLPALREAGLSNVTAYSMEHAIEGYVAAYRHVLAQQTGRS